MTMIWSCAGSGESEIRRYLLERDLVEAIVALPAGISTYVWILSNKKEEKRAGKVQLINAADLWKKMKKSLGTDDIERIVKGNVVTENIPLKVDVDVYFTDQVAPHVSDAWMGRIGSAALHRLAVDCPHT